jgi:hypothetical protein
MTTVAKGEFSYLNIKVMLKKLSTTWSIKLKLNKMSKSKLYNLTEAINIASLALRVRQRIVELKLKLLRYTTHIRIELLNGQLVLSAA